MKTESGWRHFFLFGLIPNEVVIDAHKQCGSTENIEAIETRQTFLEGLVESLTNVYYVNIYSPWDGAVFCREAPIVVAPPAPAAPQAAPPPQGSNPAPAPAPTPTP